MKTKLFALGLVLIAVANTLSSQTTRPVMSLTLNHLYVFQSADDPNLVLTMEPGQAQLKMLPYVAGNQWQQWEVYSKTYGTNIRNKYSGYCINDRGNLVPSEPIDGQYLTWQAWDLELSDDAQTVRFCHYLERWTWTGTYYTWAKGSFYTINPTTNKIDILKYDRCLVDGVRDYTGYNASNGLYFSFKVLDINTLTTPSAPTITSITAGNGQLLIAFTAGSDGNTPITNYKYSTDGGSTFTAVSPAATTSPIVITGLTNGTSYNVQLKAVNANGDGAATSNTTGTPALAAVTVSTDTNISSIPVSFATEVTVSAGMLTIDADVTVKSVTVNPGAKLTLADGKSLTIVDALTLQSDATSNATFVDNGRALTAGTTNVQQYLTSGRNWYVSSPVVSAARNVINNASEVYSRNEGAVTWDLESTSLTPVKGYVAKVDGSTGIITFTGGALNTGAQSISGLTMTGASSNGYNLVGNPYPSYVNWELATKTNLLTTMWYRSKNVGNTAYVFDTYNQTGSIGTSLNGTAVTANIPPMQAFWVKVNYGTGTLAFTNSMRTHKAASGGYTLRAPGVATQQVLRLQVSNRMNNDEAIVLFNADALDTYDTFDSPKMTNDDVNVPEIYTTVGSENLVINGLNRLTTNMELPLGFKTGVANIFSIKVTEMKNFDADTKIVLRDNLLNVEKDITEGTDYSFTSNVTNTTTRFTVEFKTAGISTGLTDNAKQVLNIFTNSNGQITINRNVVNSIEGMITVSNAVGQKLINTSTTGSSTLINKSLSAGVYFVTVNVAGRNTTRKVIIN